ncbi:hypothetical protein F5148DRAFT_1338197 [Russula earlei]|uniref:Uncharacterized protein n=1 Tax=Russula earlei TaxID=71964 RepID=A0ACC0TVC6_9AGAM|nr:hypothetical protein F5148DRAFT_1338197 [Russula earlei]
MKINNKLLLATFSFVAIISSCKKDGGIQPPAIPQIITSGIAGNKDTLTIGDTLFLHPITTSKESATGTWLIDGVKQTTDSTFRFVALQRGDHTATYTLQNVSGQASVTYQVHVYGKYENGFFIANEGWFGTEPSSVNFYRYGADTIEQNIYKTVNPANNIGSNSSNLQYGTVYNGKLYLVNKVNGPLVATDAYSLKETARTATGNWLAFAGIDSIHALLTASNGIYPLNLTTMTTGTVIPGITGQVGDIVKAGNYIFAITTSGATILNIADYTIAQSIPKVVVGFAVTPDGNVWCATSTGYIVKINPATLDVQQTQLAYTIKASSPWQSTGITASTTENAVFIKSGVNIYKYPQSTSAPFYTIASDKVFYGKGIGYDPASKQLIATVIGSPGHAEENSELSAYIFPRYACISLTPAQLLHLIFSLKKNKTMSVSLSITGGPSITGLTWFSGMTGRDVLEAAYNSLSSPVTEFTYTLEYFGTDDSLGYLVNMINGTFDSFNAAQSPYFFWEFLVNDSEAENGIDYTTISDGDEVEFSYIQFVPETASKALKAKHARRLAFVQ